MTNMTNEKVVYTRWLATALIKQGFPVVRIEKNPKKPQLDCYVFAETAEFKLAFTNLANR